MIHNNFIKLSLRAGTMCVIAAATLCMIISLLFNLYLKDTGIDDILPISTLNIGKNADEFDVNECQSNDESYSCERMAKFYKQIASSIDSEWKRSYQRYASLTDLGVLTPYMMKTEQIRLFVELKQPISLALAYLDESADPNVRKDILIASDTLTLFSLSMLTTLISVYIATSIVVMLLVWWVLGIKNSTLSNGPYRIFPSYPEMRQSSLVVTVGAIATSVVIVVILGLYFKHATLDYISQFNLL
jgi:hypothetical protein